MFQLAHCLAVADPLIAMAILSVSPLAAVPLAEILGVAPVWRLTSLAQGRTGLETAVTPAES